MIDTNLPIFSSFVEAEDAGHVGKFWIRDLLDYLAATNRYGGRFVAYQRDQYGRLVVVDRYRYDPMQEIVWISEF